MKIAKWIYRYTFFAMLIAIAGIWCFYCQKEANEIEAMINSPQYIDMAIESFEKAFELNDRLVYLVNMRNAGLIAIGVLLLPLILLVIWNIKIEKAIESYKLKKENEKTNKAKEVIQKPIKSKASPLPIEPKAVYTANVPTTMNNKVNTVQKPQNTTAFTEVITSVKPQQTESSRNITPEFSAMNEPVAAVEQTSDTNTESTTKSGFCGYCGHFYDELPGFCGYCGHFTSKQ